MLFNIFKTSVASEALLLAARSPGFVRQAAPGRKWIPNMLCQIARRREATASGFPPDVCAV